LASLSSISFDQNTPTRPAHACVAGLISQSFAISGVNPPTLSTPSQLRRRAGMAQARLDVLAGAGDDFASTRTPTVAPATRAATRTLRCTRFERHVSSSRA
jgi:hypothetical protein